MEYLKIFKNKKILVTGHTGFKGSWLISWLYLLGADVVGVSIDIPTSPSNYRDANMRDFIENNTFDIRNFKKLSKLINKTKPDFIFHLAAQALVKASYEDPLNTLNTNTIGTATMLQSLVGYKKKVAVIMITSDKVYQNNEWIWGYRENDELGGNDPYSISKTMAEFSIKSYLLSHFNKSNSNVRIGIGRAGNVIGGGDWADNRIVPDCIKAWSKKKSVYIRNPNSTRPWQHVLEPISGYLKLASVLYKSSNKHGEAYNFGPEINNDYSVKDLIGEMSLSWKNVKWKDLSKQNSSFKEASLLKLNCEKSFKDLNWKSTLDFKETVQMTINWYKFFNENKNKSKLKQFNFNQINQYINEMKKN